MQGPSSCRDGISYRDSSSTVYSEDELVEMRLVRQAGRDGKDRRPAVQLL